MGSSRPATTVVLVQTREVRAGGLRDALSTRLAVDVIHEVPTPPKAFAAAERLRPSALVMDVRLDEIAVHGVLASVRAVAPETGIVLLARAADVDPDEVPGAAAWTSQMIEGVLDPVRPAILEARLVLASEPRSVTVARKFIADLLAQCGLDRLVPESEVVVSELVANAVQHTAAPCAVQLSCRADNLRISVADSGPGIPDLQTFRPLSPGGRGLHIVSAFATTWGVARLQDGGKLVWAELAPLEVDAR